MSQVEAVDLEPVGPLAEIGLASVAGRRVARKARSDDQTRAGAKELDPRLVADFHAAAGEQSDAATQVRELRTLREILLGAGEAQAVVEMVDRREFLLADVPNPRVSVSGRGRRCEELVRFRRERFGDVMKTGWRRNLRMPVAARTLSSRCTFSGFFFRLTTFRSWRRPSASGRETRPAAFSSRLRSASGMSASRERSATIFSSRSAAARKRSGSELLSVSCRGERWDAVLVCMHSIYPLRLPPYHEYGQAASEKVLVRCNIR